MESQMAIYPSLRDKNVIITGGAEGIGSAMVELFARQGCQVLLLDIATTSAQSTIDRVAAFKETCQGAPIKPPVFFLCDVSDLAALQSTAKKILDEYGTVHILINNAAFTGRESRIDTEAITPDSWDTNINLNLRHVFFLTQAVIPGMREAGGGSIVNLGSITWRIPAAGTPVYAACKAAVMGLTRVQSKEFGSSNIRINSVMPGAIATERQKKDVLTPEYRAEVMRGQSLQRDLTPQEVAKVILFLASDEASAVTGSTYVVDGGWCSDP